MPAPQSSRSNTAKVAFPPANPSKTQQLAHQAGVNNKPAAKRKADTPAEGRSKRPALIGDDGTPDDTTFSRENGKLVIMVARTVWGTLMNIGQTIAETRTIFGMLVAFSVEDSPTPTAEGPRLNDKTRAAMVKLHDGMMYGTLVQYGLQGCRVQEKPTFEPGEDYSPTHVFPSGSNKAVYVTPRRSPAMPVAGNQRMDARITPPTPSLKPAAARNATGPAKPRAKKGPTSSVCIPDIQQGDNGVLLSLGTGVEVPVSGLSKNHQKKMSRQAKKMSVDAQAAFSDAWNRKDYDAALEHFGKIKDTFFNPLPTAPAASDKPALRIPPPKPPKHPSSCKKIQDALEEGKRLEARGAVRLPSTRGRSNSAANNAGQSNSGSAQPATFTNNAGNAPAGPPVYATNSSPSDSTPRGEPSVQKPQQGTITPLLSSSAAPQTSQGYHYHSQLLVQQQRQQQQNTAQSIDPQLLSFDGQDRLPQDWTSGFEFDTQLMHGEQLNQPAASLAQSDLGHATVQKENQQPAPASVEELLKATGMSMPTEQQGQVRNQGQPQQASSLTLPGHVAGFEIQSINGTGQQGHVPSHEQRQPANPPAITASRDDTHTQPMDVSVKVSGDQSQSQVDAPAAGTKVARNEPINSWNGMPVVNNEIQTKGYGMQPLAVVMPPGTGPNAILPEQDAPADGKGKTAEERAYQAGMEELFGENFEEFVSQDPLDSLTAADFVEVSMQQIEQQNAEDAALLASLDAYNKDGSENAMPQVDGSASPVQPKSKSANFYRDPSASKPSPFLTGAAAHAQQVHRSSIQQGQQNRTPTPGPNTTTPPPTNPNIPATPEQIAAQEAYRAHTLQAEKELADQRARDNQRNQYLAVNRDLPSQAEREKRAKRKRAHERLAQLRYITAEARVYPLGHSARFGYEEAIEEMGKLEEEIRVLGDKVLADREYAVVRQKGYNVHEHWIPEEK